MKKIIYLFVFLIVLFFAFKPINTSKNNSITVTGTIKSISEGGVKDLVFKLENNKTAYYINRGLENGFDLQEAKNNFIGKKVVLNYAKSWTLLAPTGTSCKHITQMSIDNKEIYSEWK